MHRFIFLFFFLSGLSSLVFEVIWERLLMQVFGSTTFAISTLLTAFMAGLAIGSWVGGKWAGRLKHPLVVYGVLEGGIGLYGLAVPWMLGKLPGLYGAIFTTFLDDFLLFSLLRFVAVFCVLIVPTMMMGATLPIVAQWLSAREETFQSGIGLLYGVNTFGACVGCFLAGFVLLPTLGLGMTNGIFVGVNLGLCALVLGCARGLRDAFSQATLRPKESEEEREMLVELGQLTRVEPVSPGLTRLLLGVFLCSGALSMGYQVLWTRAYVIVLGSSTYSFTLILVSFLVGLGTGSALISVWVKKIGRPVWALALTQMGVCLGAMGTFFVLDRMPEVLFARLQGQIHSAHDIYAYSFLLVGALVFLPTCLQGMSFPLVVRALVATRQGAGQRVGKLYAFNTVGAIAGSFLAGFILLPSLGLHRSIALLVGCNLACATALVAGSWQRHPAGAGRLIGVAGLGVCALVFAFSPTIDKVKLTRGLFRVYWARELFDATSLKKDRPELLYYKDGLTVTTSVEKRGRHVTLKGNGKAEASDGADMATQILVGLMPFVFHSLRPDALPGTERAVMIGYGSGVTAGASLQWPLESLEVIEIEEAMIEASRFFDHVNHKPLEDPRHTLILSDGRNYLEYNDTVYDVIVSEPSNPWIAGVASLFTFEHFTRARRHLKPGGVFGQWVQLYEISPQNVRVIFATFAAAFPHVLAFSSQPKGTDLILLGSDAPLGLPADGFAAAMRIPSVKAELARAGIDSMHDFYGLMFMNHDEFLAFGQGAPLNTDDNGYLEFQAPKDLVRYDIGEQFFTERYQREGYGDPRPHLQGWGGAAWDAQRVGQLARGVWQGGKFELAKEILKEQGLWEVHPGALTKKPEPHEQVQLVEHARAQDPGQLLLAHWPLPGEAPLSVTAFDAISHGKESIAMAYLVSQEMPGRDGYSGAKGLFYLYLLAKKHHWRSAMRQAERLAAEGGALAENPALLALWGTAYVKRLKYKEAFETWLKCGKALAQAKAR